jgi:uncharacterized membrane protein (UPF0127 family)
METMRKLAATLLVLAVGCSTTSSGGPEPCSPPPSTARFTGGAQLAVDIADDDATREHGLMGVTDLPQDQGMAFVWDSPTDAAFWMKDTLIPLSIAFVDEGGRVITVREMTPCQADPCQTYAASGPYTTAIEANAGWFEDHAIEPGDRMRLREGGCA